MTSQQPRGIDEQDMERAIEAYSGTGDFLKKILQGETRKKVEKFLDTQDQMMAGMNPSYFGVPPEVREANRFMSGYTKGDYSDPEFIKNFRIIQEFNKKV